MRETFYRALEGQADIEHFQVLGPGRVRFVLRRQRALDDVLSTDDQITFDTGAYYRPLEWLKLYANVRNALDSQF